MRTRSWLRRLALYGTLAGVLLHGLAQLTGAAAPGGGRAEGSAADVVRSVR